MIELPVINSEAASGPTSAKAGEGREYWRSEHDRDRDDDYRAMVRGERLPGSQEGPSGATRRQFLQIMGASMALAGLSACRRPVEKIIPFVRKPEDVIPGVAMHYATGMPFRGTLRPLLVESSDGRPTKIEGNPEHPWMQGSSSVFEQAALLNLYDPDRSQSVTHDGAPGNWDDFVSMVRGLSPSSRIGVIAAPDSSMTLARLRAQMRARFAQVRWVTYDAAQNSGEYAATTSVFGSAMRATHALDRASVIVCLDADIFSPVRPGMIADARNFAAGRKADDGSDMNRLYVVESQYSITGGMADHRRRMRSAQIPSFTASLGRALGLSVSGGTEFDGDDFMSSLAADLQRAGSSGVLIAGEAQPESVHALVAAINERLGAVGTTVSYVPDELSAPSGLSTLVQDAASGALDAVLVLGCNPVLNAPPELDVSGALSSVSESIHLGLHVDETAMACRWHIPQTHFLEAWGDGRSADGTMSVIQPLIAPLYDSAQSALELVGLMGTGAIVNGHDEVRETWRSVLTDSFEPAWRRVLHDGYLAGSEYAPGTPAVDFGAVPANIASADTSGYEVVVHLDKKVLDGSFSNNAWMQELPDSTTKITWDNVAVMSPGTAAEIGVQNRLSSGRHYTDRISLSVGPNTVDIPVWIQPGMAEGSISVSLGYGRSLVSSRARRESHLFDRDHYTDVYGQGALANNVGVNTAPLRTVDSGNILSGARAERSGGDYLIASTQDHGTLEVEGAEVEKRGVFRMATLAEYRANPDFVGDDEPAPLREDWTDYPMLWENRHPRDEAAYKANDFYQYQWGMTIDLSSCTGCNSCIVACQSENNIQVVGKNEVSRGREMHWIRLDRYFVSGDGASFEEPKMVVQPLTCMMCENAPCEQVCPVAATVHSSDGMNQMIYNRCIGTRYCANNCPYKVRRFNYYNWSKTLPASTRMAQNPNVTVRTRGVMEKCSYCVQRIREVNKRVNIEERPIAEGEVVTACQQACPSKAITFGNIGDPESAVSRARRSDRRYEMLAELNVKPRTSYLARIQNPNPALEQNAS